MKLGIVTSLIAFTAACAPTHQFAPHALVWCRNFADCQDASIDFCGELKDSSEHSTKGSFHPVSPYHWNPDQSAQVWIECD